MEGESSSGRMERSFKESGRQARKTVMESGNHRKRISMKANGGTTNKMGKAFSYMSVHQHTQAISKTSSKKGEAKNNFKTEIATLGSIRQANLTATVVTCGRMETDTRGSLLTVREKDRGCSHRREAKFTRDHS